MREQCEGQPVPEPAAAGAAAESPVVAAVRGKGCLDNPERSDARDPGPTLPKSTGNGSGYYVSRKGGQRMLVIERRRGQRIRIDATTELCVLDVGADSVQLGVIRKEPPDARARPRSSSG
jgi:hypothetical protein